jgi:hypothetical protein
LADRQLPIAAAILNKVGQILITPQGYSIVTRAEEVMAELTQLRKEKREASGK